MRSLEFQYVDIQYDIKTLVRMLRNTANLKVIAEN
jgi:hypothetical protein